MPLDKVLQLEPHQIDEALRRSGLYGNSIPGIRYLYEQMRVEPHEWKLGDAAEVFEWLQAVERKFANMPHPADWCENKARYFQAMWSAALHRDTLPYTVRSHGWYDKDPLDELYIDLGGEG